MQAEGEVELSREERLGPGVRSLAPSSLGLAPSPCALGGVASILRGCVAFRASAPLSSLRPRPRSPAAPVASGFSVPAKTTPDGHPTDTPTPRIRGLRVWTPWRCTRSSRGSCRRRTTRATSTRCGSAFYVCVCGGIK